MATRFMPGPAGALHPGNARTALFRPLRAVLTGRLEGPEPGALLKAMGPALVERRLARFA